MACQGLVLLYYQNAHENFLLGTVTCVIPIRQRTLMTVCKFS